MRLAYDLAMARVSDGAVRRTSLGLLIQSTAPARSPTRDRGHALKGTATLLTTRSSARSCPRPMWRRRCRTVTRRSARDGGVWRLMQVGRRARARFVRRRGASGSERPPEKAVRRRRHVLGMIDSSEPVEARISMRRESVRPWARATGRVRRRHGPVQHEASSCLLPNAFILRRGSERFSRVRAGQGVGSSIMASLRAAYGADDAAAPGFGSAIASGARQADASQDGRLPVQAFSFRTPVRSRRMSDERRPRAETCARRGRCARGARRPRGRRPSLRRRLRGPDPAEAGSDGFASSPSGAADGDEPQRQPSAHARQGTRSLNVRTYAERAQP